MLCALWTPARRADASRCVAQVYLSIGSALLLPATLLAFLRPIPLPYSWAAPPEPLSRYAAIVSLAMIGALAMYHGATLREIWRAERTQRRMADLDSPDRPLARAVCTPDRGAGSSGVPRRDASR